MNFRVEMTKEQAERIMRNPPVGSVEIRYGHNTRDYRADHSGFLQVVDATERSGGNAGRIIVIRGFLSDTRGKWKVVLKCYPKYLPPKGMTVMTVRPAGP